MFVWRLFSSTWFLTLHFAWGNRIRSRRLWLEILEAETTGAFKAYWLLYVPPDLTFANSTLCPQNAFLLYGSRNVYFPVQHWLVYLTETECVYCAVRTEYWNIIQVIPCQSMCDFVVDKVALGQVFFFRVFPFSTVNIIPPMLLLPGQTGEAWEPSKRQCCFGTRGALDRKVLSFNL